METTTHVEALSIIPYLYTGINARNILESYSAALREVGGRSNQLHANMLEHYVQISEDKEFIFSLQNSMYCFYCSYIHAFHKAKIFGRKKSLISLEDKCNLVLSKNKPPEIKDSIGFRIILFGKSKEELVYDCYQLMDKCIDFFISKGFNPTEAEKRSSTPKFNQKKYPKIFVPKKSYLKDENKIFVKDYVVNPKDKGYQSLHVVFIDSQGREFEVQIRTYQMDEHAELGPAAHPKYKADKYKNKSEETRAEETQKEENEETTSFTKIDTTQIDINKISSEDFIVEGTEYYDSVGIFIPRTFFAFSNI